MPLNCGEELIAGRLKQAYGGKRRMIIGRTANATQALAGRAPCQYRDACWLGCPYGAYFSTQSSTLPAAAKTGKLTLKPWSIAVEILFDKDRRRASGVRVLDALTDRTSDYSAKVVFVCASTLNSTWLLMRSATDVWPGGLGSSSGELGHNLMDHHFRCGAEGQIMRAGRQVLLWSPPQRHLCPAVPQPVRRQTRLPARFRLPGQSDPGGLVTGGEGVGGRSSVQG